MDVSVFRKVLDKFEIDVQTAEDMSYVLLNETHMFSSKQYRKRY